MTRETAPTDKAVLTKEVKDIVRLLRDILDTGQESHHSLLAHFQSFADACIHRNSSYVELQISHEELKAKYTHKLKEHKQLTKKSTQQTEELLKKEQQLCRLSFKKSKKSVETVLLKKEHSLASDHHQNKVQTHEKAIQSQEIFQQMEQQMAQLKRQNQQLLLQLRQSQELHRDKLLQNESIKYLLQKMVEDRKINGFGNDDDSHSEDIMRESSQCEDSDDDLSQCQSYNTQKLEQPPEMESPDGELSEEEVYVSDDEDLAPGQQKEVHGLLWKSCQIMRGYLQAFKVAIE